MKLRQSPRLRDFDYKGPFAYNLTLVTRGRLPIFKDGTMVQSCLNALTMACERNGFDTRAFCFMPDHLHLLLAGREGSSLQDFVRYFKQVSGYHFRHRHGAGLWQISYYDHVLRRDEDVEQVAAYIWDNPVRAGLVDHQAGLCFFRTARAYGAGLKACSYEGRSMLIATCQSCGPPKGRVRKYVQSVKPVGFPNAAVLCRTVGCFNPALIWLDEPDWKEYQKGERFFLPISPGVKIRVE